ncbi:Helicase conserved C-terminal domain-containing protein [Microlunatus sagamiharensis]|uniref:Helicase conserved C-terminal domain-containing protein n=1 Tax=Microlunatus sagamiharensis TaxID=546874 RepID=A0A1H2M2E8_9ACTN|nr:DEAD/DEAH box helicase [Microlunatus sagamiharensis]SDU87292.1 Helicase conserved C-terminal domain-containing protein [Microlunatus sagamiharensis]
MSAVGLGDVLALLRRDAAFDPGTRRRGQEYAAEGRVGHLSHEWDGGSLFASGLVSGTVGYRASIVAERTGPAQVELRTSCTCPVAFDCKHVFALVCALTESMTSPGRPDWRAVLDDVLDEVAARSADAPELVPLGVELVLPKAAPRSRWGPAQPSLRLWVRPVRGGRNGRWVRKGAEWSRIGNDPYAPAWSRAPAPPEADPRDLAVLAELKTALLGPRSHLGSSGDALDLHTAGAGVWPALRHAVERGMPLVASEPEVGVRLATGAAEVGVDVRRDDGEVVVSAGLVVEERAYVASDVALVGEPPHGVVVRQRTGETTTGLVLAPLGAPVPSSVRAWLGTGQDLRVAADAAPELVGEYLPALAASVAVTSRDGSVDIPGPAVVTLRGEVTWDDDGLVELAWRWLYRRGDDAQQFAVDEGPDSVRGWRDRAAEAALVERLHTDDELDALLGLGLRGPGTLSAGVRLRGAEAMHFAQRDLPRLRAHPDVEILTNGAPPQFREVTGVPQVQFHPRGAAERKDRTDWLDLEVLVSVEDDELGTVWLGLPTVLTALATGQTVVMLHKNAYVDLDRPELDRLARLVTEARAFSDRRSARRRARDADDGEADQELGDDVVRLNRQAHGLLAEVDEIGATQGQLREWAAASGALRRLARSEAELPTEPLPDGLRATLRPYQHDGYQWLTFLRRHGLGGVLADDMGLGKTVQTLAMIARAREETNGASGDAAPRPPFLVVVPSSVVGTWVSEAERFTPGLRVVSVTSSATGRGFSVGSLADHPTPPDVVVTTYTLLRLEADAYAAVRWSGLVLDEAQAVKNHRSKTWAALRDVEADCRFAITGTPLENNLMELWSILSLAAPGLFPYAEAFRTTVAQPIEQQADPDALPALLRKIKPVVLRRTKELVAAELPPKQVQVVEVELSAQHRRVYDTHLARERQRLLKLLDDPDGLEQNRITILASLTRLRQLALDPALVDPVHEGVGSAKLDELVERLNELAAEGHRALVFSQFTRFLARLRHRLDERGTPYAYLDGSTTRRSEVVEDFRRGSAPVFLISLKAGGVGLNLTEADYVFVLDPWWNPAVEAQAIDRTHRIGQTRPVNVYRLVSAGTVEQKVVELSARKAALFASVLDGEVALGTTVTARDLAALVE